LAKLTVWGYESYNKFYLLVAVLGLDVEMGDLFNSELAGGYS
jgi:hypothetical protein